MNDYERADILAQIAELLTRHAAIGPNIAFKGGAIMTLVDASPRLSADLDGVMVTARAVTRRQVEEALGGSIDGRRVVVGVGLCNASPESIEFPFIKCLPFSGSGEVNIRVQISWREPLEEKPVLHEITIPRHPELAAAGSRTVRLPVVSLHERAAEKVRAFLERGLPRDAIDLFHYATRVLQRQDDPRLKRLIQKKLERSEVEDGTDLHAAFDEALALAATGWTDRSAMVLVVERPEWPVVERTLRRRFKPLLRSPLRR